MRYAKIIILRNLFVTCLRIRRSNAKRLVSIVKPTFAVFVKYEFWFHYTRALKNNNIPILSISSIFRSNQLFFKPYGGFYRGYSNTFSFFFVQNEESLGLLRSIGIQQCTLAGDTRFDRVLPGRKARRRDANRQQILRTIRKPLWWAVAGPKTLMYWRRSSTRIRMKFIIAPHEISEQFYYGH